MTTLKAPCPHGHYDPHWLAEIARLPEEFCPGGSLLPPDSLVIVKEDGEWPEEVIERAASAFDNSDRVARQFAVAVLDVLAAAQPGRETITTFEAFNVKVEDA